MKEIERFIFRPNIKLSSQFYAINFLNTINFSTAVRLKIKTFFLAIVNFKGSEVLKEVIKLLFILFKKMIDSKEEDLLASKILSQILRGINKIFPHTKKNVSAYILYCSPSHVGILISSNNSKNSSAKRLRNCSS